MESRQELENKFIELRTALLKRRPSDTRGRAIFFDALSDIETLAKIKTNEDLEKEINRLISA